MKPLTRIDWQKAEKIFKSDEKSFIERFVNKLDQYPHAKTILTILATGGLIGLAAVSPAAPLTFYSMVKVWKSFNKKRLKQTIFRFRKQKLVKIEKHNGQYLVRITKRGLTKALSYKLEDMKLKEQEEWDGKWRMIIFDISDKKRRHRDFFQRQIKSLGFYQLQESVYVCPYPCFDEVEFLRQIFGVGIEVKYVLAEKIEDDEKLRNHFRV